METVITQYEQIGQLYMEMQKTGTFIPSVWARSTLANMVGSLKGKVVVDAGCGNGHDAVEYIQNGACSVLGFDPSQVMLSRAEDLMKEHQVIGTEFRNGSYENIPFDDACADVVIGIFSLHYVSDLNAAFVELARITKPGGKIAFVCNHPIKVNTDKISPFKDQEIVSIKIYDGAITIQQPSHDLSDYFCPIFFKNFSLEQFVEYFPEDDEGNTLRNPMNFLFCATRL